MNIDDFVIMSSKDFAELTSNNFV